MEHNTKETIYLAGKKINLTIPTTTISDSVSETTLCYYIYYYMSEEQIKLGHTYVHKYILTLPLTVLMNITQSLELQKVFYTIETKEGYLGKKDLKLDDTDDTAYLKTEPLTLDKLVNDEEVFMPSIIQKELIELRNVIIEKYNLTDSLKECGDMETSCFLCSEWERCYDLTDTERIAQLTEILKENN